MSPLRTTAALLLVACASITPNRQLSNDEVAIVEAVLNDPYVFNAPGMREHAALADSTDLNVPLGGWVRDVDPLRFCELEQPACTTIPSGLANSLREANEKPATLSTIGRLPKVHVSRWATIPGAVTRILVLSRPAINSKRTHALIAIERRYPQPSFGPDGFAIYLEKHDNEWRVIRHGAHWIV